MFFLSGCIQTDQITYLDNHNSMLVEYRELVDIPALFQYGEDWEAVSKIETKYSSLYERDNKREIRDDYCLYETLEKNEFCI